MCRRLGSAIQFGARAVYTPDTSDFDFSEPSVQVPQAESEASSLRLYNDVKTAWPASNREAGDKGATEYGLAQKRTIRDKFYLTPRP